MFSSIIVFGLFVGLPAYGQVRPPNFSPDRLPDTSFTCEDKVTGGYYADVEAHCQLFHVCVQVSDYEFQDFHFLCPNDTVFDQQHLVCTNWFEVDCHAQIELVPLQFFTNDFGVRAEQSGDEDVVLNTNNRRTNSNFRHGFRNTGRGQLDIGRQRTKQNFQTNQFEEDLGSPVAGGGTPIPLGFTTTIRPPTKPSSQQGFLSGRNLVLPPSAADEEPLENTVAPPPAPRFSPLAQDGRRPKVKSNLKAKFRNSGQKKFGGSNQSGQKQFRQFRKNRQRVAKHQRKEVVTESYVTESYDESATEPFYGPDVRPDGREPRVKADLLADLQNHPETTTLQPFIETFFASPSSPKPFIFRGSPTPDLYGSASTVQPFFVPTAKAPTFSGISQTPLTLSVSNSFSDSTEPSLDAGDADLNINDIEDETTDSTDSPHLSTNRFRSRPSPARFNSRRRGQNSRPVAALNDVDEHSETNEVQEERRQTFNSNGRHIAKNRGKKIRPNQNSLDRDEECNNPFRCPSGGFAGKRRPRVKSNIRANKRNFWQDGSQDGGRSQVVRKFGGAKNRKLRRGRKQRVQLSNNSIQSKENADNEDMEEKENMAEDNENNAVTESEPFVPTVKPETTVRQTTVSTPKEEQDIFEDLFEQNNDLIVASSTISSVVFKGSPSPAPFGFFSSPGPSFDKGSGVFVASPRPSFTNIGNDIDLGPKKFLSANEGVFVTSTQSNKIFIGSVDEATPKPNISDEKRTFPSFPIRGKTGSLSFPFRPKPSFAAPKLPSVNSQDAIVEDTETTISEFNEDSPVTTTSAPTTKETQTARFNPFSRTPNRRFNSLFNRNSAEPTTTTQTTTTSTTTTEIVPETTTEAEVTQTTGNRKFPFNRRQNKNLLHSLRNQKPSTNKPEPQRRLPVISRLEPVTTVQTESPTTEATSQSSILSVESELLDDSEIDNEILDQEEEVEAVKESKKPRKNLNFRRFQGVKKAHKPPPNANIRVEFKKAPAGDDQSTRKFFVKPDGRKPRVKSNIRARLANKGKSPFVESTPTGFRHSTKVDDLEFNGDKELENVDNTEKRAIDPSELNLIHTLHKEQQDPSENAREDPMLKNGDGIVNTLHTFHTAKPQQQIESAGLGKVNFEPATFTHTQNSPSLPIFQPEPLTLNTRPSNAASALLEQIIVKSGETGSASQEIQSAQASSNSYAENSTPPSLSAFHALLSQTKSDFPFELLNPRDVAQV